MTIGIDVRFWHETGVGRYIRNLVKELIVLDKKNEYVLFSLSKYRKEIAQEISSDRISIVTADVRWHTLTEQIKLPSILGKKKIDLMHFPYFSIPILYNGPYVVTIHDLILHHFPTGEASTLPYFVYRIKHTGYRQIISLAARRSKKIISVSEATKKEIIRHLPVQDEKIQVIYEGIDTSVIQKPSEPLIQEPYFLHVGNVYPHKNMKILLQAFEKISDPKVRLIIVGREDYFMKKLKKIVTQKKLHNRVIFKGYISDSDLSNMYAHAQATVVPSFMEGFSLPALEALQNKSVVLVSDIAVHREICKNAVTYFSPHNPNELYSLMLRVLAGKINTTLLESRSQKVLERYSWRKAAIETLKVYESSISI